MTKEKAELRGYTILAFIVVLFTVIAGGFKFKTWITNGTFQVVSANSDVATYVQDNKDPATTFTILATGHDEDFVSIFPLYLPNEKQVVALFRIHFETKTKTGPYYSIVIPKLISITNNSGEFRLAADEGGRTENVGYVRQITSYGTAHYTIPVDTAIPNYYSISLGRLPEMGDQINFWYVQINPSKQKFFNLAILY